MPKIDLENIEMLLAQNKVPTEVIVKVISDATKILEEEKAHRQENSGPAEKFEYAVLVSDPENKIPANTEVVSWVLKCRAGGNLSEIPDKLERIVRAFNASKAGQKAPVKTMGELFQWVKRKFWKPEDMYHVTKEPVRVFYTNNKV